MASRDQAELDALSRRFRPALVAFFMRRLRDHARAEDLTQELFAKLLAMPNRDIVNTEGYLFQMAMNLIRDHGRHDKIRADYAADLLADEASSFEWRNAERILLARESIGRTATLLNTLPERTRAVLILYRIENMPRKRIAEALGVSISSVDKHLAKAMAMLVRANGAAHDT